MNHVGNTWVDGNIIVNWILRKQCGGLDWVHMANNIVQQHAVVPRIIKAANIMTIYLSSTWLPCKPYLPDFLAASHTI